MHRPELNINGATIAQLAAEVLNLRADIALIAGEFVKQAYEREWCGDYEQWARMINRKLTRPVFIEREDLEADDGYIDPAQQRRRPIDCVWCNGVLDHEVDCGRERPFVTAAEHEYIHQHANWDGPYRDPSTGEPVDPALDESGRFSSKAVDPALIECPAGGQHIWTDEMDERYTNRRVINYVPPANRWHCAECGIRRPFDEVNQPYDGS